MTLVVAILANTALVIFFAQRDAEQAVSTEIGRHLTETAHQLSNRLDQDMWTRSRELSLFKTANIQDFSSNTPEVQRHIDFLSKAIPLFTWIGFVDPEGRVLAATNSILVGQDISKRPVFSEARERPFIGDVHDAVLLSKLLPNPSGESMKFVDISSPIRDHQGRFLGVLAAHLSWDWVRELQRMYFEPFYDKSRMEVCIVSADGVVLLGPSALLGKSLNLPLIQESRKGIPVFNTEIWPDGNVYLTGAAYGEGYDDYPGLGWTVLIRQPAAIAFAKIQRLRATIVGGGLLASFGAVALAFIVSSHLTRPLNAIVENSGRLSRGEIDNIPSYVGIPDIEILTKALRSVVENLTLITREKDQMKEMAFRDPLTGLANRAAFQRDIQALAEHITRKNQAVGILYLDLDGFKAVNDTLGHAVGDLVLQTVAARLPACLRQGDVAYRLGGDEFVLLVQIDVGTADEELSAVAARIIQSVRLPFRGDAAEARIGVSLGGAVWPGDAISVDAAVCYADAALYRSKRTGKNVYTRHYLQP